MSKDWVISQDRKEFLPLMELELSKEKTQLEPCAVKVASTVLRREFYYEMELYSIPLNNVLYIQYYLQYCIIMSYIYSIGSLE